LVRGAAERAKRNTDRLREFTDASLPLIQRELFARVPTYSEIEVLTLSFSLERMREWLGPDDPTARKLLSKESPSRSRPGSSQKPSWTMRMCASSCGWAAATR